METEYKYLGNYKGTDMWYSVGTYSNGRKAYEIYSEHTDNDFNSYYEPYAVVTINLPDVEIPENSMYGLGDEPFPSEHCFINADLDEGFKEWLRRENFMSYPVRTVKYNYGTYELSEILVDTPAFWFGKQSENEG